MACLIAGVVPGSPADILGIAPGDTLLEADGEAVLDLIDYQALTAKAKFNVRIRRPGGTEHTLHVHKQEDEPLGLSLDQSLVARPRECRNHCIFCFIDQMPPNMRDTLYVKDDDWRLSLMMGNFVTLTNVDDAEFDRILRRHVSPLYISVHCTDPARRVEMMRNPRAALLMDQLRALKDHGIRFHCQVVLCPGWNDGAYLEKTLADLFSLWPAAQSVALVPVGLTKWREKLPKIQPYQRETAAVLVSWAHAQQRLYLARCGSRFVFPSDEFYCLAQLPLPEDEAYEGYPQIENGVGMLRQFETDLKQAAEELPCGTPAPGHRLLACGTSVAPFLRRLTGAYAPKGSQIQVVPVRNRFFGESVTVTGLLTGQDLLAQLQGLPCDELMISRNTLRTEGDLFLDGMSLAALGEALQTRVRVVGGSGSAFWRALCGMEEK